MTPPHREIQLAEAPPRATRFRARSRSRLDGDELMDRMYAADMGGQVWRFDVTNGARRPRLSSAGDRPARHGRRRHADARREPAVYYSPDVAFVNTRWRASPNRHRLGHREHPIGMVNSDRFYAIRDKNVPTCRRSSTG